MAALASGLGDGASQGMLCLIDGPREVLDLELRLFREKADCDKTVTEPEDWPLTCQSL
ncbi:hypothetical protein V1T76_19155 [Roseibium sp. FZY0029]|uniref:hypothetical protein n=1 Tax=Roseibium sp. FZY0029 TaxID=3116647 RepID=UPI002EB02ACF|nr:hypothetical protein [Roseibium sp. FZY0029]